jgi:ArsR family transcriptional regulator
VTGRSRGPSNFYALRNGELPAAARRLWHLVKEQTEGWATVRQDGLRLEARLRERSASQAFFARSAERWDRLRQELYGSAFGDTALLALLGRDLVVADLACGTWVMVERLAPFAGRVLGLDNSAAMLKAARRRLGETPNVELRQGDLEELPLDDAACDAALLVLALTYVAEPGLALREAGRVLRPGGRLVVVDLLRHDREDFRRELGQLHPGFEPAALESLAQAAGFSAPRCAPLPPEPHAKGPALLLAVAERAASPDSAIPPSSKTTSRPAQAGQRGRSR